MIEKVKTKSGKREVQGSNQNSDIKKLFYFSLYFVNKLIKQGLQKFFFAP